MDTATPEPADNCAVRRGQGGLEVLVLGDFCVVGQLRHGVQRVFVGVGQRHEHFFIGAERLGHHDDERTVLGEVLAKSCAASETLRTAESCRRVVTCETAWMRRNTGKHSPQITADLRNIAGHRETPPRGLGVKWSQVQIAGSNPVSPTV